MKEKLYISITGTTGAGKSTLLMALSDALSDQAQIIRQTTTRLPRSDDTPGAFQFLSEEEFKKQSFFIAFDRYGITADDYQDFLSSDKHVGLSVNGANEITQLKSKSPTETQCRVINIVVTYSDDAQQEAQCLQREVREIFNAAQAEKRFISNKDLCDRFFFNSDFIKDNIHIQLTREQTPQEWARKIVAALPELGLQEGVLAKAIEQRIASDTRKNSKTVNRKPDSGNKLSPK